MRTLLRPLLRVMLRIFFRRIEITGAERVPSEGPVIFVLNHPNGLIDPAFLLCLAPRNRLVEVGSDRTYRRDRFGSGRPDSDLPPLRA